MEMRLPVSTIIIVIIVLIFSVFIANISNLIAIQVENSLIHNDPEEKANIHHKPDIDLQDYNSKHQLTLGDGYGHLMWFIQISDLHISIFHESTRITEFQEFCERTVSVINPALVLATGDLTDAKTADNMGSAQQVKEWEIYKNILYETGTVNKTVWLDIRGNHDNFNIPTPDSRLNYYRKYTVQGGKNPHSYLYTTKINGDMYGFLGIDACLSPGPKRPFNFVGILNRTEINHINHLINEAKKKKVQYTVVFGHYPTSCIIHEGSGSLRNLIAGVPGCWAYLCGHFHMLGGLVPNMYTLQKTGYLELELGDWKDNRLYRVAAIDHGLFSFIDVYHGEWPVMLITNPKHALFAVPAKESKFTSLHSSHIRVLVFSLSQIELVQIQIDGENWTNATNIKGPLFVLPWDPKKYRTGMHSINVRSRDSEGRERGMSQPFAMDGTRMDFKFWPRVALMTNISALFQSLFGMGLCFSIVPLCLFKVAHVLVRRNQIEKPKIQNRCIRRWIRSFWILSTIDKIFFPLVMYSLYLSVGPWTVGEVIDGHIGAVFAWGLLVNNSYLPGSFTYAYGFLQMVTFHLPLTVVLAKAVDRRYRTIDSAPTISKLDFLFHHIPFVVVVSLQIICAYFFWLAYGTLAFFLGFLRTWSIVLAIILWKICHSLDKNSFREASRVWGKQRPEGHVETDTCNL